MQNEYQIERKVRNSTPHDEKGSTMYKKVLSRNCQTPDQSSSQTQSWGAWKFQIPSPISEAFIQVKAQEQMRKLRKVFLAVTWKLIEEGFFSTDQINFQL